MSRETINLCDPVHDLPPLDFELGDTFEAVARIGREHLEAQRQQQNEREQRKQG